MKFKVGDRVRIKSNLKVGEEYDNGCSLTHGMEKFIGKTATVTQILIDRYKLDIDDNQWFWSESMVEGKTQPAKPTQFVVFYLENGHDPMKEFADEKELTRWLSEAKEDEDIDFKSIRIFKVDHELKITTKFSLSKV